MNLITNITDIIIFASLIIIVLRDRKVYFFRYAMLQLVYTDRNDNGAAYQILVNGPSYYIMILKFWVPLKVEKWYTPDEIQILNGAYDKAKINWEGRFQEIALKSSNDLNYLNGAIDSYKGYLRSLLYDQMELIEKFESQIHQYNADSKYTEAAAAAASKEVCINTVNSIKQIFAGTYQSKTIISEHDLMTEVKPETNELDEQNTL